MIARVGCFAKQGCRRWLFPPCYRGAKSDDLRDARADFPFVSRGYGQRRAGRLWPAACFPLLFTGNAGIECDRTALIRLDRAIAAPSAPRAFVIPNTLVTRPAMGHSVPARCARSSLRSWT